MRTLIHNLDSLLRGSRTSHDAVTAGGFDLPLRAFFPLAIILGAIYGFFMGWYALLRTWGTERQADGLYQLLACMVKVPALFFFTLVITFPSLYVFNALIGCRLSFAATLRLLVGAIVINVAVAASLGPIVAFFTFSTNSYNFMQLLNVAMLGIAGAISLGFLLRALRRYAQHLADADLIRRGGAVHQQQPAAPEPQAQPAQDEPAFATAAAMARARRVHEEHLSSDPAGAIFKVWVVIYALVGAQMGWIMRPFIGHPDLPFSWFRARSGNFFLSILHVLRNLAGID